MKRVKKASVKTKVLSKRPKVIIHGNIEIYNKDDIDIFKDNLDVQIDGNIIIGGKI